MKMAVAAMLAVTTVTGQETKSDSGKKGKPLKVYILAGQSNATGMVHTNTLAHIKMFPETAKEFADLFDKNGAPVVLDDVYISQWKGKPGGKLTTGYGGGKAGQPGQRGVMFGPEFAFGIYMHKKLQEPFLIIKTSQGGKDINFHFRPPSADKWIPPAGHPDLTENEDDNAEKVGTASTKLPKLPLPTKIDLSADWTPEKPYAMKKKHMGVDGFKGSVIEKVNGVSAIYMLYGPTGKIKGDPFVQGDLILGVDGSALGDDPIQQWRDAFYGSKAKDGDWMITITRWRKGKIETFDFDICDTIPGGRAKLPEYLAEQKRAAIENEKMRGGYYRDMIAHVKSVLGDIKTVYPAYDEKAGYELAGFLWFQGWNDMINQGLYPNRDKPRGYEQYSWLLEHFIRDVRKELNAPKLPFVIGVMGIGGVQTEGTMGYFQQAMAAPASNPEFKGTVAAVQTGKYWDHELAAIVQKANKVKEKMNEFRYTDGLTGDALTKACADYRATVITAKEEEMLKKGVSDGDFHYLGSAKIMCGIGKGFAEAMIGLQEKK
jgi:Carbohydrate esterase, sialic acid-specific acetylesterase